MKSQALDSLVSECQRVASEIIEYVSQIEARLPSRKWENVYRAVQSVWKKDKIDAFQKRLESLQSNLALRILLVLNAKVDLQADVQNDGLERLAYGNHEIVEVMSINQVMMRSVLARLNQGSDLQEGNGSENVTGAILTLQNGETKVLTRMNRQIDPGVDQSGRNPEQTFVTLRTNPSRTTGIIEVESRSHDHVQREILECLYFRQITDRVDEVAPAHRKTFEWIFNSSSFEGKPWDDLPAWLESGSGCYWVNGKAGAGKSTLMKYIRENEQTKKALHIWANGSHLIMASFFFWNLGSKLQRSQSGLLRALLFDVVQELPDLAPLILPGLYRAVIRGREDRLNEPSYAELKKGFQNLILLKNKLVKVCLIVDGVDEYEGDHAELSEMFAAIPSSSCVKVVLSSRPIPACVEVFSRCEKLQLQELTRGDVKLYVTDRICENAHFQQIFKQDTPQAQTFLDEIVNKASGVFLWVIIVVRGVLDGLRNGDRLGELRTHLDGLPDDLDTLYHHMLEKLNPVYRSQAAEIFQITFRSITLASEEPLTTMHLAHIENEDPEIALALPIAPLSIDQRYSKCLSMEFRIRSRCCGLVEVLHDWSLDPKLRSINSRISFLHRTVAEFLQNERVWNGLLALTRKQSFEVNLSLSAAYLMETKTNKSVGIVDTRHDPIWRSMRASLQYARLAESLNPERTSIFVDELDNVMASHWQTTREYHAGGLTFGTTIPGTSDQAHWAVSVFRTWDDVGDLPQYCDANESIYSVAAAHGLINYLKHKLSEDSEGFICGQTEQALLTTISSHARNFKKNSTPDARNSYARFLTNDGIVPSENYVAITCFLLKRLLKEQERGTVLSTAWGQALKLTTKLAGYSQGFWNSFVEEEIVHWVKLLEELVLLGADVNATVELGARPGAHRQSASLVIMTLSRQLPPQAISLRSIIASFDNLKALIEARGAIKREWLNGKLVLGVERTSTSTTACSFNGCTSPPPTRKGFRHRLSAFRKR
jgi:hypothetical protein